MIWPINKLMAKKKKVSKKKSIVKEVPSEPSVTFASMQCTHDDCKDLTDTFTQDELVDHIMTTHA